MCSIIPPDRVALNGKGRIPVFGFGHFDGEGWSEILLAVLGGICFQTTYCLSDNFFFKFGLFVDKAVNRRIA